MVQRQIYVYVCVFVCVYLYINIYKYNSPPPI